MTTKTFWTQMLGGGISFYDAGGMRTRCLEAGAGEPVILLHGMGGHAEAYIRNVLPLAGHFHVYAIDMAGCGFTDEPTAGAGVPGLLDHLIKFMDAIGAPRAHLVGESLGGWVSTWAALKYPARVNKVISVCGAGLSLDPEDQQAAAAGRAALTRLSKEAFENPTRESVRARLAWLFHQPDVSITDELLETRYQIYLRRLAESKKRGEEPGLGTRPGRGPEWMLTRERLAGVQAPYLFLWTDHNPTTPWQVAEKAHKAVPGSHFHLMKNFGHWPQYEDADTFNKVVTAFLRG